MYRLPRHCGSWSSAARDGCRPRAWVVQHSPHLLWTISGLQPPPHERDWKGWRGRVGQGDDERCERSESTGSLSNHTARGYGSRLAAARVDGTLDGTLVSLWLPSGPGWSVLDDALQMRIAVCRSHVWPVVVSTIPMEGLARLSGLSRCTPRQRGGRHDLAGPVCLSDVALSNPMGSHSEHC